MGVGIYPAFNPPVPEAHLGSDGKLLAEHLETLDQLAEVAGVSPLSSFTDQREPVAEEDILDLDEFMAFWDEWFAASEGRRTVKGLLSVLRDPSNPARLTGEAIYLPRQLEKLLHCLRLAEAHGAQFRIEVRM